MDMSINISLSFIILVFTLALCCAVFINFSLGYIVSKVYRHSIASKFMQSLIKNGQSSTFSPLDTQQGCLLAHETHGECVFNLAGGDLVILPRAEGSAGVCLV